MSGDLIGGHEWRRGCSWQLVGTGVLITSHRAQHRPTAENDPPQMATVLRLGNASNTTKNIFLSSLKVLDKWSHLITGHIPQPRGPPATGRARRSQVSIFAAASRNRLQLGRAASCPQPRVPILRTDTPRPPPLFSCGGLPVKPWRVLTTTADNLTCGRCFPGVNDLSLTLSRPNK